jgi:hypothetical protein
MALYVGGSTDLGNATGTNSMHLQVEALAC